MIQPEKSCVVIYVGDISQPVLMPISCKKHSTWIKHILEDTSINQDVTKNNIIIPETQMITKDVLNTIVLFMESLDKHSNLTPASIDDIWAFNIINAQPNISGMIAATNYLDFQEMKRVVLQYIKQTMMIAAKNGSLCAFRRQFGLQDDLSEEDKQNLIENYPHLLLL